MKTIGGERLQQQGHPMTLLSPATSTAIVILDYQPALLGFLADSDAFVTTACAAADALRDAGGKVAFVRVAFTEEDYARFPTTSVMGQRVKGNRPGLDAESPTAALHGGLAPHDTDWVLRKTRVGAFSTTNLDTILRSAGIDTVVLAGVHTSGAVLTTVREAHDLDYQVLVLADACADPDRDVHEFLIEHIIPRQGRIVATTQLLAGLSDGNE
jgi:nicotinamidase-related amidase